MVASSQPIIRFASTAAAGMLLLTCNFFDLSGSGHADPLGDAFGHARSIVRDWEYRGMGDRRDRDSGTTTQPRPARVPSPTLDPTLNRPVERPKPPPPSPTEIALGKEIEKRERYLEALGRRQGAWEVALEKLLRNEHWIAELEDWAHDSELAEVNLLVHSVRLLLFPALLEAVEVHHWRSVDFWDRALKAKKELDGTNAVLDDVTSSAQATAEAREAARILKEVYNDLVANMRSELVLATRLERFTTLAE